MSGRQPGRWQPQAWAPAVRRHGYSLLEVILATAILFGGLIALAQMTSVGLSHGQRAEDTCEAMLHGENLVEQLKLAQRPLADVPQQVIADDPRWQYSIAVTRPLVDELAESLAMVKVSVWRSPELDRSEGAEPARAFPTGPPAAGRVHSIVRWIRIPETDQGTPGAAPEQRVMAAPLAPAPVPPPEGGP